ncbi:MAG: hypothetical protein CMK59_01460 [Proteobacteria bacterium]|nr:hypothetical protein [Pseudomonadota bacterium]
MNRKAFPSLPLSERGRIVNFEIDSLFLRGNTWGDPSSRSVHVYLPKGYEQEDKDYPLVVFLPAYGSTGQGLLSWKLGQQSMTQRLDRLIAEGAPPCIAIFPDCLSSLVGTQFIDSAAVGRYGSYLMKDVLSQVRSRFRCTSQTGLIGHSSGGYGALRLAIDFPQEVCAVVCHAGDMGFATGYCGDLALSIGPIRKAGSPMAYIREYWGKSHHSHQEWAAMNILCMSCVYAPVDELVAHRRDEINKGTDPLDPNLPFPSILPVNYETGEIDFQRFLSWEKHDPIVLIDQKYAQEALKGVKWLFLDAGAWDEYHLQLGAQRFCRKLTQYGIPHIYEEFPGGHRGTSYRFDRSLPELLQKLSI